MKIFQSDSFGDLESIIDGGFLGQAMIAAGLFAGLQAHFVGAALRQQSLPFPLGFALEAGATTFSLAFVAVFLPLAICSILTRMALPTLKRAAQRLVALTLYAAIASLNFFATVAANPLLVEKFRSMRWILSSGPSSFLALRLLILGCVCVVIVIHIAKSPLTSGQKAMRLVPLAALALAFLINDWQKSQKERTADAVHSQPGMVSDLTVFVPSLGTDDVDFLLKDPHMERLKEKETTRYVHVPTSTDRLPQIMSALSGLQPWQHSLRTNTVPKEMQSSIAGFLQNHLGPANLSLFTSTAGSNTPSASILPKTTGILCDSSSGTWLRTRVAEENLFSFSQISLELIQSIFPYYKCTQRLLPLSTLVRSDASELGQLFRQKKPVRAIWVLEPAWPLKGDETARNQARLTELARTLGALSDYLHILNIENNVRLILVGLGAPDRNQNFGPLLVFHGVPQKKPETQTTNPSQETLAVGSSDIPLVVATGAAPHTSRIYQETLDRQMNNQSSRAIFYAKRTLFCAWKAPENQGEGVLRISMMPQPDSLRIATLPTHGLKIFAAPEASKEECLQKAITQFHEISGQDISLPESKPLEQLFTQTPPSMESAPL